MLPILQIGPVALQLPGLIWLLGLWIGLSLAEHHAKLRKVNPNNIYNLSLITLISGIIGARLGYAAMYPQAFIADPISLISLNLGLFDMGSGLAVGTVAGLVYGRRKSLNLWNTLDVLTPTFAVMQISAALANLASGSGFGSPTDVPWAIQLWGTMRHPVQIYEALVSTMIFLLIWYGKLQVNMSRTGALFFTFLALSTGERIFLEAFRGDSYILPGGLRLEQLTAWVILAVSLWWLGKEAKTSPG
jgi:phosphatidylglycerol---prolipoprotein diacylglyceryl transferase